MKTVVIWDAVVNRIQYFVVDGDVTHLDRKYIGEQGVSLTVENELSALAFNSDGSQRDDVEFLLDFPVQAVKDGAQVIVCGILP